MKVTMLGDSKVFRNVVEQAIKVSRSDASIMILGESGTGKDLLASFIHRSSPRNERPFVAVNCAAIPETLLESELFGHIKGAFTGAYSGKKGKFEKADKGTLFMDEIGDMSLSMQSKILQALQHKIYYKLGSTDTHRFNTRVITATNKNIEEEIDMGKFRTDLYYRLNTIILYLPTLRMRGKDLGLIAEYYLQRFKKKNPWSKLEKISKEIYDEMYKHNWPGNVRELKHVIERAVILEDEEAIPNSFIRMDSDENIVSTSFGSGLGLKEATDYFKKIYVRKCLNYTNQNCTQAAELLKIQRTYLSRLKKEFSIE